MSSQRPLSIKQRKAQDYLETYNIQEILADLLNTLVTSLPQKPIIFMIKYLSTFCSEEDLKHNNIIINGPFPPSNLAIVFPEYKTQLKNLFKAHLTPAIFTEIKDKRTSKNVTLRNIISTALENEEHPIGVFAHDEDSYHTFSKLFDPILEDLNPGVKLGEQLSFGIEEQLGYELQAKENKMIKSIRVKIRRNLATHAFNNYIKPSERERITQQVQNALGKLESESLSIEPLGKSTYKHLLNLKDRVNVDSLQFIKEAMNNPKFSLDRPRNSRYKEWPAGRTVAINKAENYYIFVNKEDHIELNFYKEGDVQFYRDSAHPFDVISKLQQELVFSNSQKYGYLSANPKYTGLGISVKIRLQIPEDKCNIFRLNLANINFRYHFLSIEEANNQPGCWIIKSNKNTGFTETQLFKALQMTISFLLTNVIEDDKEEPTSALIGNNALSGGLIKEDELKEEQKQDSEEAVYSRKSLESGEAATFKHLSQASIEYPKPTGNIFDIIKNGYFVVRRNVVGLQSVKGMSTDESSVLIEFLKEFVNILPSNLKGEILYSQNGVYNQTMMNFIEKYDLMHYNQQDTVAVTVTSDSSDSSQYGTAVLSSANESFNLNRLIVITNLEDHFTLIYNFESDMIINGLNEIYYLLQTLEKIASGFIFSSDNGYQTANHRNASGAELAYVLKLTNIPSDVTKSQISDKISVYTKDNDTCLRITNIYPSKIKDLLEFVYILIQDEKYTLYNTQYQAKLREIYDTSLVEKLESTCSAFSHPVLDTFNKHLQIQPYSILYYTKFAETYLSYLSSHITGVNQNDNTNIFQRTLPNIKPTPALKDLKEVSVKVEVGRNLRKYSFKPLLTNLEREELYDVVTNAFDALRIEGHLVDPNNVKIQSINLSYMNNDHTSMQQERAFVSTSHRLTCLINSLDHIRLISEGPINELSEQLKLIGTVLRKVEEDGHEVLYDPRFGYISQRLDLCGTNLSIKINIKGSDKVSQHIVETFEARKHWYITNIKDQDSELIREIVLTTKSPGLSQQFIADIYDLVSYYENIEKSNDNPDGTSKETDKKDQKLEEQKAEDEIITEEKEVLDQVIVTINDGAENSYEYQNSERENSTQFASPNKEPVVLGDIMSSPEAEERFENPIEARLSEAEEEKEMYAPTNFEGNKEDKAHFQGNLGTGSNTFLINEDKNFDDLKLIPKPVEDPEFEKNGDLSESPFLKTRRLSRLQANNETLEENSSENRNESVPESNRIRDVFKKFMTEDKPLVRHSIGGFPMIRDTENIQGGSQDNHGLNLFESIRRMSFEQRRENLYNKDEPKGPELGGTDKNENGK